MLEGIHFTPGNANSTINLLLRDWELMDSGVVNSSSPWGITEAAKKMAKHLPREQWLLRHASQGVQHFHGLYVAFVKSGGVVGAIVGFGVLLSSIKATVAAL